jgi:hypothetical protein
MDIGIKIESCRNRIKLELVMYVLPLLGLCAFLAGLFGYHSRQDEAPTSRSLVSGKINPILILICHPTGMRLVA